MNKVLIVLALTAGLAGCASDKGYARDNGVWGRNPAANTGARADQAVIARNAKEAQCKHGVEQRPGADGSQPRDYKCKEHFA